MKTNILLNQVSFKLVICLLLLGLYSCAQFPKDKPVGPPDSVPEIVEPESKPPTTPSQPLSMVDILLAEAEKFNSQENYSDALFVYNQALAISEENRYEELIEAVESTLSKMPSEQIRPFIDIKNLKIPQPMLMYWLGLNAVLENNDIEARDTFTAFLFEYPDHAYAPDVFELLTELKASLFKKNTIGCLLPMTGKYALFGERALTGIQLAIESLSKKYNNTFSLVIYDTQAEPERAVEGVRYLNEKKVAAIIGPLLTVAEAGAEAEKLGIPMIGMTQKNDFALQGDFLFSNFITPQMQVQTLGSYLFRDLGITKAAILYPNEKYGQTYMELFWDVADEYGARIVGVEPYDGKNTDFTEPIQKLTGQFYPVPDVIKNKERQEEEAILQMLEDDDTSVLPHAPPAEELEAASQEEEEEEEEKVEIDFQALFIPDSPSKVNQILPQLAFNDATGMYIVGTNLWHHKSLLKDARGYNKRAVITDGFFDKSKNPATVRFADLYQRVYQQHPQFLEAIAYDNAMILFSTAADETVDSRAALKDALKNSRIFEGATGHTLFDQDGRARRQLFLITVKRGRFVEISR
jgi:branched-chain amino acid transport system substrate-binding protein